ncbi:hypothetical protein [Amycolatopsis thermophila]|uniref:MarR family transcriptional regulator n=1 Tax=Amycolatopsis thermophila TaxID=206084 RepID=A0ABU0EVL5_9PSEU|nr:hypothetical protein [Amycolatopsis thermophila]MDQ0378925.1 hypothetical protein [Amycolatopsis thermophila]
MLTDAGQESRTGVVERLNRASPLVSPRQDQQESLVELLRALAGPQGR